jgi:hypothetical protein
LVAVIIANWTIPEGFIPASLAGESRFIWRLPPGYEPAPFPAPTPGSLSEARRPPHSTYTGEVLFTELIETCVSLAPALHAPWPPTSVTELIVALTPLKLPLVEVTVPSGTAARLVLKGLRAI